MTRLFPILGCVALLAAALVAQQPSIQNGRVESRRVTTIEREIAAVSPLGADQPAWVAWRAPIVDGERGGCSYYSDSNSYVRGWAVEDVPRTGPPQITQPTGPVPIEAGTGLVMLVRVVGGKLERFRTLGDDCPIDAGGRTIHWLDGVTPAESLRYLDTLTRLDGPSWMTLDGRRTLASDALGAIALHREAAADAILDRVAASAIDEPSLQSRAASMLGRHRGAHGFATLQQLLKTATTSDARRSLVSAIALSRQPGAVDTLRALARDGDDKVRAEAAYRFAVRGGPAVASEVLAIVDGDAVEAVRNRAVSGIAQWPNGEGVPQLITLARSSRHPSVRKQAVSSLSASRDPRAITYLESLLK